MSNDSIDVSAQRMSCLLRAFWLVSGVLVVRLIYLQFGKKDECIYLSQKNYTATELLPALRGNFVDTYGHLLVSCRPVVDLYWVGKGNRFFTEEQKIILALLESTLGSNASLIARAERYKKKILLGKDVSLALLSRLYEASPADSCLHQEHRFTRTYPYGSLACHVIGYLNRFSFSGKSGLEAYCEQELQGKNGVVTSIKNAFGQSSGKQALQESKNGKTLSLTIDLPLQAQAEQLFSCQQSGVLLLMDPEDGALRVAVSYPGFDPNKFLDHLSSQEWEQMVAGNNPLLNRFSHAAYPPGSLFKLVTLAAGYEDGFVSDDTVINCKGSIEFCGRKYYCMRRWGHGMLTIKQALARSCNVLCYEIARMISIDRLAYYATLFGLGRKTGFILGEQPGLMPTSSWKRAYKKESWWQGETISASIGQSFVTMTPLQAARMVASIYQGYLVKPRILNDEEIVRDYLPIKEESLLFLRDSMREAVQSGTVKLLHSLKNFVIYAKTGTAQTCALDKVQGVRSREQQEHAWFASWFRYKNNKPLVLIVLLEHAGSSRYALDMAKKFFDHYQAIYEYRQKRKRTGAR